MKENKVVTISAQIPADLEKSLIKLCEFEERSKSYFIKKALEKLIQEKIKEVANSSTKKLIRSN
jgi:predicted DNA-binding protein